MGFLAVPDGGTFGITGLPKPDNVQVRTDPANHIPYVTGMPLRYEITEFLEKMTPQIGFATKEQKVMQRQWTLFVLGLEQFKARPVNERLSYFQVAGIHGFPEAPWDGAGPPRKTPDQASPGENPYGGYCNHNTILFPTWHRPYLLLFEQCIWLHMDKIIKDWKNDNVITKTEADEWDAAAKTWRMFYWDWARKQKYPQDHPSIIPSAAGAWNDFGVPYIFSVEHVPIFHPKKGKQDWPNPLWHFENPEKDPVTKKPLPFGQMPEDKSQWNIRDNPEKPDKDNPIPMPWGKCSATSRWGILHDKKTQQFSGLEGKNEWKKANTALSTAGTRFYVPARGKEEERKRITDEEWKAMRPQSLADSVNRMFCVDYNGSWGLFSSTKWYAEETTQLKTGYMSLEFIHNNIHAIAGGSSFGAPDPDADEQPDPNGIYGVGQMADVPVAAFDPIFWFHHANVDRLAAMWQCLNWDKWFEKEPEGGSSRPNVEDPKPDDPMPPFHLVTGGKPDAPDNQWTSVMARDWTNSGYQYDDLMPPPEAVVGGKLDAAVYEIKLRQHINQLYASAGREAFNIFDNHDIDQFLIFGEETAQRQEFMDYVINVTYDRYAIGGRSYSIIFLLDGHYVGQVHSLGGMRPGTETGCANCGTQQRNEVLSRGQVPITVPLIKKAVKKSYTAINTLKAGDVDAYLSDEFGLTCLFMEVNGKVRPAEDFPRTEIRVLGGKAKWVPAEQPPDSFFQLAGDLWWGNKAYMTPFFDSTTYQELPNATNQLPDILKPLKRVNLLPRFDKLEVKLPEDLTSLWEVKLPETLTSLFR